MTTTSDDACPCREREPYSDTWDLEQRLDGDLERVAEDVITCRRCGRTWRGEPQPGGVYGDTRWTVRKV